MKAVKKLRGKIAGVVIVAASSILLWQCANPTNKPLRWQSVIDVPLTNDSFFLGQQLTNLNGQNITVVGSGRSAQDTGVYYDTTNPLALLPDTKPGDTITLSLLQNDSVSYILRQDSMQTQNFHPFFGPIPISNAPVESMVIPLPAGSFNIPSNTPLSKITSILFDSTSPAMPVTITNNSSATIDSLSIAMLGTKTTTSLGPNSSTTLQVPVAGQTISNGVLPVTIQGSAAAAARITVSFSCNGLLASYVQAMDSLISFSKVVTNDYNLTDTLDVDYIDILTGAFVYAFHNYTSIPLQINITQLNLWQTSYCVQNSLVSVASLTAANALGLDSSFYFGQATFQPLGVAAGGSVTDSLKYNLAGLRLFPIWDPNVGTAGGESVSRVIYTVSNVPPTGATETLWAGDSMLFTIRGPNFKFLEMAGTVMLPYVRAGDTAKVAVPYPWDSASSNSLRNRLILSKVWADIFLKPNLPDSTLLTPRRAMIDTLGIQYTIFNPANPSGSFVDSNATLHNVVNDTTFRLAPTNITSIVNQFPDSLYIAVGVKVPVGTHVRAINELTDPTSPDYKLYMGEMFVKANVTARMNVMLSWNVDSMASLDLGTGRFQVPKATRYITKMDGIQATIHMTTLNKSNLYLNLYALMASKAHMNALDSLSLDSVWAYIADTGRARSAGYIDLLGSTGVQIPARDSTAVDTVVLNEWQIDSVLLADSAGWRWEARFLPMNSDALIDTDFVKIRSWMHLVGNNNMDSLLIWH